MSSAFIFSAYAGSSSKSSSGSNRSTSPARSGSSSSRSSSSPLLGGGSSYKPPKPASSTYQSPPPSTYRPPTPPSSSTPPTYSRRPLAPSSPPSGPSYRPPSASPSTPSSLSSRNSYNGFTRVPPPAPMPGSIRKSPAVPSLPNLSTAKGSSLPTKPYISKLTGKTYPTAEERRQANQAYREKLNTPPSFTQITKRRYFGKTINTVPLLPANSNLSRVDYQDYGYHHPPSRFERGLSYSPTHGYYAPSFGYVALGMNPEFAVATGMMDLNAYFIYKALSQNNPQATNTRESQEYRQSTAYSDYDRHFKVAPPQDPDNGYSLGDYFKSIDDQQLTLENGGTCLSQFDATLRVVSFSQLNSQKAAALEYFPPVEDREIEANYCRRSQVIVPLGTLAQWNSQYLREAQVRIAQQQQEVKKELGDEYQIEKDEPNTTENSDGGKAPESLAQQQPNKNASEASDSSTASIPTFKVCGGPAGGNYTWAMKQIINSMDENSPDVDIDANVIATNGSGEIFDKVSSGECNAGIIQSDVLYHKSKALELAGMRQNPNVSLVTFYDEENENSDGFVYEEMAYLMCRKDMNVTEIGDLAPSKKHTVLIPGGASSGSAITWKSLVELDNNSWVTNNHYDQIPVRYVNNSNNRTPYENALNLATETPGSCIFIVSSPNSQILKTANDQFGQKLVLVNLNDRSFDDNNEGIALTRTEIDGDKYENLLPDGFLGMGKKSISTISMHALVIVNSDFHAAEESKGVPNMYTMFANAISQTIGDIRSHVSPNSNK